MSFARLVKSNWGPKVNIKKFNLSKEYYNYLLKKEFYF